MAVSYQGNTKKRFQAWKLIIEKNLNSSEQKKLEVTNNFFNEFDYFNDTKLTGGEDHWETPEEFIVNQGGDCEDFAIIKYFTLVALGVPQKKLRITYVKAVEFNQAHMVVTYYAQPESDPLVLDNLEFEILPASKRADLVPVYSFNGEGLWLAKTQKGEQRIGGSSGIDKWRNLIDRMLKR
jgi:predicted transglutaminase-like cysteine proteinase